jgi:hypothetical protein
MRAASTPYRGSPRAFVGNTLKTPRSSNAAPCRRWRGNPSRHDPVERGRCLLETGSSSTPGVFRRSTRASFSMQGAATPPRSAVVRTGGSDSGSSSALRPVDVFGGLVSPNSTTCRCPPPHLGDNERRGARERLVETWGAALDRAGGTDRRAQSPFAGSLGTTRWPVRSSAASM